MDYVSLIAIPDADVRVAVGITSEENGVPDESVTRDNIVERKREVLHPVSISALIGITCPLHVDQNVSTDSVGRASGV